MVFCSTLFLTEYLMSVPQNIYVNVCNGISGIHKTTWVYCYRMAVEAHCWWILVSGLRSGVFCCGCTFTTTAQFCELLMLHLHFCSFQKFRWWKIITLTFTTQTTYPSFWPEKSKMEKYGPVFSVHSVSRKHYANIKQWEYKINKKVRQQQFLMHKLHKVLNIFVIGT